jgi:hypothetical protein
LREGGCSPAPPGVFTRQHAWHRARSRKLAGASRNECGASRRSHYCAYRASAVWRPGRHHTRPRRSSAKVFDEGPRHVRAETSVSSQTPRRCRSRYSGVRRGVRGSGRLRAVVTRLARRTREASQR